MLEALATAKSYARGYDLYLEGAVSDTYLVENNLIGKCEGRTVPFYDVEVELDENGIGDAYCSCLYDWGGFCKHIIALLLTYTHEPEKFVAKQNLKDQLSKFNRETLVDLVIQLSEKDDDLYFLVQNEIVDMEMKQNIREPAVENRNSNKLKNEYREEIRNILHSLDGLRWSQAYWMMEGMVERLGQIRKLAYELLDYGKNEQALIILSILFTEVGMCYEQFDDSNGALSTFLSELPVPLAEAILSIELSDAEKNQLTGELGEVVYHLRYLGFNHFDVILAALDQGWVDEHPDECKDYAPGDFELNQVKLNVLERAGRVNEFLELCLQVEEYQRYLSKRIEMGDYQETLEIALRKLKYAYEALVIAQAFEEAGHLDEALQIAERGLDLEGKKDELGVWLGPLEEKRGRQGLAIRAYICVFSDLPSIYLYQKIKTLEPDDWKDVKQRLLQVVRSSYYYEEVLVDIHLFEKEWDQAIEIVDKLEGWNYSLIAKVADAVMTVHPEWVIAVSQRQAEDLIARVQRKYYVIAADWLKKMKIAYTNMGREAEWQTYLEGLRMKYQRRPALQEELRKL